MVTSIRGMTDVEKKQSRVAEARLYGNKPVACLPYLRPKIKFQIPHSSSNRDAAYKRLPQPSTRLHTKKR